MNPASHRLIKNMCSTFFGFHPKDEDKDLLVSVFEKSGGSWEKLFLGSSDEIARMKKIITVAIKKGFVNRS